MRAPKTPWITVALQRALIVWVTLVFALCFSAAFGPSLAYAYGDGNQVADGDGISASGKEPVIADGENSPSVEEGVPTGAKNVPVEGQNANVIGETLLSLKLVPRQRLWMWARVLERALSLKRIAQPSLPPRT